MGMTLNLHLKRKINNVTPREVVTVGLSENSVELKYSEFPTVPVLSISF